MTHVPETGARKIQSIYGAGFWIVCHGYKSMINAGGALYTFV